MSELALSEASISTLTSEISEDRAYGRRSRSESFGTSFSEEEDKDHFHLDAVASIYDGLRDGLGADVVQLELVGLRMSANASEHQVRRAVVAAFMKRIQQLMETGRVGAGEAVRQVLTKYKDILDRIVFDRESDGDKPDQVDLLLLIQKDLVDRNKGETVLLFTAKELYDLEMVEEEAFEQWWQDERSSSTEALKRVRNQTQQFVEWLASTEADSDSEGDETDDE
jgi:translation initiation factor eIF-2B subunit epsilon